MRLPAVPLVGTIPTTMEAMEDHPPPRSVEEQDQFQRSVRKFKRVATADPPSPTGEPRQSGRVWADLLKTTSNRETEMEEKLYMGTDEDDDCPNADMEILAPEDNSAVEQSPGRVIITVPSHEWKKLCRPWRRALIVKLLGRTISYRVLSQRLTTMWSSNCRLDIVDLEDGYYVVRFFSKKDYDHALENGPWTIQGHYLTVSKFRPGFAPSTEHITSTLVWIRIPRLPLEFFDETILMRVGNELGKAVKIDTNTMQVARGKYARVCVEVDLSKPLTSVVVLNGHHLKIEYESLHQICFTCGKYGHRAEECAINTSVEHVHATSIAAPSTKESPADPFGPWMIARNRNRRRASLPTEDHGLPRSDLKANMKNIDSQHVHHASTSGSRFTPIYEDVVEQPTMAPVMQLAEKLRSVPDPGPAVTFRTASREVHSKPRERRSKGVLVKDTSKVKVRTTGVQAKSVNYRNKSHLQYFNYTSTVESRGVPNKIFIQKPLVDITNISVPAETFKEDKGPPNTLIAKAGTSREMCEDLTKVHPPDMASTSLMVVDDTDLGMSDLHNVQIQATSVVDQGGGRPPTDHN